jgi:glycine cleavage system H lipoate-binding protein
MVILVLIAFVVMIITIDAVVQFNRKIKSTASYDSLNSIRVFNVSSILIPKGLYFDKTHTWAFLEKNGTVKIGIDDFLLHITGPINKIKMKNQGERVQKGEPLFSIFQKGKHLSIKSPISGIIKNRNNAMLEDSSILNTSPLQEGWIYEIEPANWLRESQFMIMTDTYRAWLKNEFTRLKDFLAYNRQINNSELAPLMLQDGGELKDHVLADFGPEIWEEFQSKFIDNSN